jgi:hypothetical protein
MLRGGIGIAGAKAVTYQLDQVDVGSLISVRVSYTDGQGLIESITSSSTSAVLNVNDEPTGSITISGALSQGATLTADTSALADADGLGALSYQWLRGGAAITGATSSTYQLDQADVNSPISVRVSYTDDEGRAESIASASTSAITNVNDAPTGEVKLSGKALVGNKLTAGTASIEDGMGWVRSITPGCAMMLPSREPAHFLMNSPAPIWISRSVCA